MRSIALILPALLATAFAAPRVEAQQLPTGQTTTPTTPGANTLGNAYGANIQRVAVGAKESDKEELDSEANVYISGQQCTLFFDFEFTSVPRIPVMELWVSTDGTDCSASAPRSVTTAGTVTSCWFAGIVDNLQGKDQKFSNVPGINIFNESREPVEGADARTSCAAEAARDKPYYLWFVPLATKTPNNAQAASAPITSAYRVRFNLFTAAPQVPTGVKVKSGESAVTATWDELGDPKLYYRAYFAPVTDEGAACGAGTLLDETGAVRNGSDIVVDNRTIFRSSKTKSSAKLKDLTEKGIAVGTKVAVGVAAEDFAGNIGPLSVPQCAEVVDTIGVIDACGNLDDCGLETCSLSPASRGSWFGLSLFVLALAALIRRRTA
jgi:MYXO-CTERM domain-containing protein